MFSKTHQGVVKKTVVLEFENGYQITLDAGVEMSMHLVMDEAQLEAVQPSVQADGAAVLPHEHDFSQGLHCSVCGEALF